MISHRVMATVLALTVASGASALGAQAQNAVKKKSTVSIQLGGDPGEAFFSGRVKGSPKCVQDRTVIVKAVAPSKGKIGTAKTSQNGKWTLTVKLGNQTMFQAKAANYHPGGGTICSPALSPVIGR